MRQNPGKLLMVIDYLPVICNQLPQQILAPQQQMRPANLLRLTLLISLLFLLSHQTNTISYTKSAAAANMRASFQISAIPSGSIITAYINQNGGNNAFNVLLWPALQAYPNASPEQTTTLTGSATYNSAPVKNTAPYRMEIVPSTPSGKPFPFSIRIVANNITVGSFSDVARYDRIFPYYHATMGTYGVSATLQRPGNGFGLTLTVYGPFASLQVNGGSLVGSAGPSGGTVSYNSNGNQYYYAVIHANDLLMLSNQQVSVKVTTDLYACPNDQDYSDYNSIYQGCTSTLPTVGFPCNNFDSNIQKCTSCFQPYVANSMGVCVQSTTCPPKQYYQYGQCYDVISNCVDFDFFGGLCHSCDTGYNLVTDSNTGGQCCQQVQQVCNATQYLMGDTCYNLVANCADFQSSTATCNACQAGYTLTNNSCLAVVASPISCPLGQNAVNGLCTVIDQYCIFYNQDRTCMLCAKGYRYGSKCGRIQCKDRQYSASGQCVDVSPFCGKFDPIYGNCLTCIPQYNLFRDGTCVQVVPGQVGTAQSSSGSQQDQNAPCSNGFYEHDGTCVQVSPLCFTYDSSTGACTTCIDSTYYLFPQNGTCVLISSYCGYRTYFSNGNCLPVSNLCDQFDSTNGNCISCRDGSSLIDGCRCVFNQVCGDREYHAMDGSCARVNSKCGDYNPDNGQCLSCVKNYELNDGGVCCYSFNYMLDPLCIKFFASNCAGQRANFNNCMKCNSGYTLNNGVFGRCNPISNNSNNN